MGIGGSYILAKSSKLKDLNYNKDSLRNLKNSRQKTRQVGQKEIGHIKMNRENSLLKDYYTNMHN